MQTSSPSEQSTTKAGKTDESGALAAWGLIIGALAGGLIGLFFGRVIGIGMAVAAAGWVTGALIERNRR